MIESVFIIVLVFAVMMNLMGWLLRQKVLTVFSLMIWLSLVLTNSLYIEVPGVDTYTEIGLQALALMFIFTDILYFIIMVISIKGVREWLKGDWGG